MKKIYIKILFPFLLILFLAFNFQGSNPPSNWYQQFLPSLPDHPLADITFTDSLTGYIVTGKGVVNDSNYILKTTNGGDNWQVIFRVYKDLTKIKFLNSNTGFVSGGFNEGGSYFIKTTNGGLNWNQIITPGALRVIDFDLINQDTIWIMDEGMSWHIYKSIDGGNNWISQYNTTGSINKLYFFNKNIGFFGSNFSLYRTTNGGTDWLNIPNQKTFYNMYFVDSLTGWKSLDSMQKTTDGGLTWKKQTLPTGGNIASFSGMDHFWNINKDTIWGTGGLIQVGFNRYKGFLYFTSNGGTNWAYQVPDTSFGFNQFGTINFINSKTGWSYASYKGIHTTTGGDTTFLTGIKQTSTEIPKSFTLKQNYPNPFNPKTIIGYELKEFAFIILTVFDITGKEVLKLVNQKQNAGIYEVDFSGQFLSSGPYFYKMEVTTNKGSFIDSKKMLLLK